MIVVDSSVWIDFLRDKSTPQVVFLEAAIEQDAVLMGDLIRMEVLQGCRHDREFDDVLRITGAYPTLTISDDELIIEVARNYRRLRAKGVTVRKTIDALIATRCILDEVPLLYSDRDFDAFVERLGLRSALQLHGGTS